MSNDFQILNLSQECKRKDETLKVRNLIGKGRNLIGKRKKPNWKRKKPNWEMNGKR